MEAVMIARHLPGLGDPWKLTLAQWNGVLDRLTDILENENACDAEKAVANQLKQIKRRQRRAKARTP